jgi:hypothetical protein
VIERRQVRWTVGLLSKLRPIHVAATAVLAFYLGVMCHATRAGSANPGAVPAQVALGERLFLETRFSQPFFARQRKGEPESGNLQQSFASSIRFNAAAGYQLPYLPSGR